MIEAYGDLWTYPAQVRVITTNGVVNVKGQNVMGAGCAREARDRYPGIDYRLGSYIEFHGNRPFIIYQLPLLVSFPTKHHWRARASRHLIESSATTLVGMADKYGWSGIVLPRPGCGKGSLDWESEVRPILAPLLDDRFTVLTFERPRADGPSSAGSPTST